MSQSTNRTVVDIVVIADEAMDLLEATREQFDMLVAMLRAIHRATPDVLATLSDSVRSSFLDTQRLAILGEQSAVNWSEYLEQQTGQLKDLLDAAGGDQ